MSFADFDLAPEFTRVLQQLGYTRPTPVQEQSIPIVFDGHDLIGCAQTGSGKTCAYMLPILTLVAEWLNEAAQPPTGPLALVLVPTRELAGQVVEASAPFAKALDLRVTAIYGGVSINNQIAELRKGVDVVVATPGRLLDHMASGRLNWNELEFFVLDEGDRMLDIGFLPDIRRIEQKLPRERQTLLFSATMPRAVQKLADSLTKDAKRITIGDAGRERPTLPEGISHGVFLVNPKHKRDLLMTLLEEEGFESVLVFTRTRAGVELLCATLARNGVDVERIHGDMEQRARQKALDGFKRGEHQVLVATDVAARGLDIEGISHVINFDFPATIEDYIHRVGRTGRADATGDAFSLVTPEEWNALLATEQAIDIAIPRMERNGLTYSVQEKNGRAIGRARRKKAPVRW